MQINKAKLASGDRDELLKLARTIRPSTPLNKTANPIASQFFDDEPVGVKPLSTDELAENLAGASFNEWNRWIEALSAAGYDKRMQLLRPTPSGDVSQIGSGGAWSGWTPPKPVSVATGAKAATTTGKLERALLNNRLAKGAQPNAADSAILVETLKSIVHQLLGVSAENFDANAPKAKIAASVRANPALGKRLTKALGIPPPDVDLSLAQLLALGAKVEKDGSSLRIAV